MRFKLAIPALLLVSIGTSQAADRLSSLTNSPIKQLAQDASTYSPNIVHLADLLYSIFFVDQFQNSESTDPRSLTSLVIATDDTEDTDPQPVTAFIP